MLNPRAQRKQTHTWDQTGFSKCVFAGSSCRFLCAINEKQEPADFLKHANPCSRALKKTRGSSNSRDIIILCKFMKRQVRNTTLYP